MCFKFSKCNYVTWKMHPFSANQTRVKCSNRAGDNQSRSRILLYFWLSVKLHVVFFPNFSCSLCKHTWFWYSEKVKLCRTKLGFAMLQEVNEHDAFPCLRYMHFPNLKNYWSTISVQYFGAPCFLTTRDGEITVIIWKSLWLSRFTELIAFCFKIALNFRTNFLNERANDVWFLF